MGRVLTNNTAVIVCDETALGVADTVWDQLEPNDISTFGATTTTVARDPISSDRSRRKGTVTDLESAVELEHDLTKSVFLRFIEGFMFANFQGDYVIGNPTGVDGTADEFDVPSGPVLIASHLVYARGMALAINNGLHEVTGIPTATTVPVSTDLVDETPAANATLELAGYRFPTSDLGLVVTGTTAVLTSATIDTSTIGIQVGQLIHIGGLLAANQFDSSGGGLAGYARVTAIDGTARTITCDKLGPDLVTDDGASDTVDLLFGLFCKNVATDDVKFFEQSFQFELALPGLDVANATMYEYALGNYANTMAISVPLTDKATITIGFIGTDTDVPVSEGSRKTGASDALAPLQTSAFNTSADVMRLRVQQVDETGLTSCFQDFTLTLTNNISPQKCIGTLGAVYINVGNLNVDIEGTIVLTEAAVKSAVRDNETVTLDLLLENDDGAIGIDLPSLTLGDGTSEYPRDESVLTNLSGQAFKDATFGTQCGVSTFPVVPA